MTTAFDPLQVTDEQLKKLDREELEAVVRVTETQAAALDKELGEWFFKPEELEEPEEVQGGSPKGVFFAALDYEEEMPGSAAKASRNWTPARAAGNSGSDACSPGR